MSVLFLRASAAPLNMLCPGSARAPELRIDDSGDPARLGTAAHEALAMLVESGDTPWESLAGLALKYGVHETELRILVAQGAKLWREVSQLFEAAFTELDLSAEIHPEAVLTGHADIASIQERVARGADWKTGRKDSDYSEQMKAYCALILLDNPRLDEATVTILWVRDGEIENYTMRRADLPAWVRSYVARVVEWDGVFHPGSHCQHCPRSHECEASNAHQRRDVAIISDKSLVYRAETSLATMAPAEIAALQSKADMVRRYAERVLAAIKDHVVANGDVVADGVCLTIDTREKKTVDAEKAWPLLEQAGFADAEFAECVTLSLSKVNSIVARKAGRGKGAAAVRDMSALLNEADAISITEQKILARKRA